MYPFYSAHVTLPIVHLSTYNLVVGLKGENEQALKDGDPPGLCTLMLVLALAGAGARVAAVGGSVGMVRLEDVKDMIKIAKAELKLELKSNTRLCGRLLGRNEVAWWRGGRLAGRNCHDQKHVPGQVQG